MVALTLPMLDSHNFMLMSNKSISIITTLILNMKFSDGEELQKAANMLSLFPCLRELRVRCLAFGWKDKNVFGQWQPAADTITCLNKRLKYVVLHGYYGTVGEVQFASFLMAGAKALRAMRIMHGSKLRDKRSNTMKYLILKSGKASSEAQVSFEWRSAIATNREDLENYARKVSIIRLHKL
ncbi:hypothetical protein VPH35_026496 [Triticum aestivum]